MPIPFRPVPRVTSRSAPATCKGAETMVHPKTLIEFMQLYPTEDDCRRALFEHRWASASKVVTRGLSRDGS